MPDDPMKSSCEERHEYREDCPGCQVTLFDGQGGRIPDEHPVMVAAKRIWAAMPLEERKACHRVWIFNSRAPLDLIIMQAFAYRLKSGRLDEAPTATSREPAGGR